MAKKKTGKKANTKQITARPLLQDAKTLQTETRKVVSKLKSQADRMRVQMFIDALDDVQSSISDACDAMSDKTRPKRKRGNPMFETFEVN